MSAEAKAQYSKEAAHEWKAYRSALAEYRQSPQHEQYMAYLRDFAHRNPGPGADCQQDGLNPEGVCAEEGLPHGFEDSRSSVWPTPPLENPFTTPSSFAVAHGHPTPLMSPSCHTGGASGVPIMGPDPSSPQAWLPPPAASSVLVHSGQMSTGYNSHCCMTPAYDAPSSAHVPPQYTP